MGALSNLLDRMSDGYRTLSYAEWMNYIEKHSKELVAAQGIQQQGAYVKRMLNPSTESEPYTVHRVLEVTGLLGMNAPRSVLSTLLFKVLPNASDYDRYEHHWLAVNIHRLLHTYSTSEKGYWQVRNYLPQVTPDNPGLRFTYAATMLAANPTMNGFSRDTVKSVNQDIRRGLRSAEE